MLICVVRRLRCGVGLKKIVANMAQFTSVISSSSAAVYACISTFFGANELMADPHYQESQQQYLPPRAAGVAGTVNDA